LFDFKKWCPTFAKKHINPFFGGHTKKGFFMGENLLAKVTQNFSGKWEDFGQKSFACPKICLLLQVCPGVGQKYICREAKSGKILFPPLETKKTTFLAKHFMGKCQISISWGPCPPTPMPLNLFITERLRKITNIYLAC